MIDIWKLYDLIYDKVNKLLEEFNPCNIRMENGTVVCNNERMCTRHGEGLCCTDCQFLGERGCTTKCLGCKVGMCEWGHSNKNIFTSDLLYTVVPKVFIHKMDRLRKIAIKYGLNDIRKNKERLFDEIREKHPLFYWQKTCI